MLVFKIPVYTSLRGTAGLGQLAERERLEADLVDQQDTEMDDLPPELRLFRIAEDELVVHADGQVMLHAPGLKC